MNSCILAAILFWGILTQWVPGLWALSAFQISLFALMATGSALVFAYGLGRIAAETDRADHAAWERSQRAV